MSFFLLSVMSCPVGVRSLCWSETPPQRVRRGTAARWRGRSTWCHSCGPRCVCQSSGSRFSAGTWWWGASRRWRPAAKRGGEGSCAAACANSTVYIFCPEKRKSENILTRMIHWCEQNEAPLTTKLYSILKYVKNDIRFSQVGYLYYCKA